jgi:hypothetical protein
MSGSKPVRSGLSLRQARALEYTIVLASIAALVLIFQPFSVELFSIGAGAIILVGLVFNMVPFCTPGRTVGSLVKIALIIAVIFAIVTALSLASAELYAYYIAPPAE